MKTPKNISRYLKGFVDGAAKSGRQLSAEFEVASGLRGISANYKFPDQQTATQFDYWASSFCSFRDGDSVQETRFVQGVWGQLVRLNPELGEIKTEGNPLFIRNGIFGAASLFNPDDINFFIELPKITKCDTVALLAHSTAVYEDLSMEIDSRTGVTRQWVASPETLLKIYDQVKDRPAIHAAKQAFDHVAAPPAEKIALAHDYISHAIRQRGGYTL